MQKITYLKNAFKTLKQYDKPTRKRIIEAVNSIPKGDVKKLQGNNYPPLYRLRVGKYRIIYNTENTEILIVKIDTRGDVYK